MHACMAGSAQGHVTKLVYTTLQGNGLALQGKGPALQGKGPALQAIEATPICCTPCLLLGGCCHNVNSLQLAYNPKSSMHGVYAK